MKFNLGKSRSKDAVAFSVSMPITARSVHVPFYRKILIIDYRKILIIAVNHSQIV